MATLEKQCVFRDKLVPFTLTSFFALLHAELFQIGTEKHRYVKIKEIIFRFFVKTASPLIAHDTGHCRVLWIRPLILVEWLIILRIAEDEKLNAHEIDLVYRSKLVDKLVVQVTGLVPVFRFEHVVTISDQRQVDWHWNVLKWLGSSVRNASLCINV